MTSHVLHIVCYNISGEAAGEITLRSERAKLRFMDQAATTLVSASVRRPKSMLPVHRRYWRRLGSQVIRVFWGEASQYTATVKPLQAQAPAPSAINGLTFHKVSSCESTKIEANGNLTYTNQTIVVTDGHHRVRVRGDMAEVKSVLQLGTPRGTAIGKHFLYP